MTASPKSNRRIVAVVAGIAGATLIIGGAAVAVTTHEAGESTATRAAANSAEGVLGYAWNTTDSDIDLEVRESGSRWSRQTLPAFDGEAEFVGHDKGNAGVDVFGSAKHADGQKVFFELDESLDYGNTARIGTESQLKSNTMQQKSMDVGTRWTVTVEGHTYTIDRQPDSGKYTLMNISFDS